MSARPVRRSRVFAFIHALGYDPNHVLRVRVYPDRVEVDAVESLEDAKPDTYRHELEGRTR